MRLRPHPSGLGQRRLDEVGGSSGVAAADCVPDGVFQQVVVGIPTSGDAVQTRSPIGCLGSESGAQSVREQMVVAVPLPLVVERDEEHVVPVQLFEHLMPVRPSGERIAERTGEPVQDRGGEQELTHVLRQAAEHLLNQVVQDKPVASCEGLDESGCLVGAAHRQSGELQSSRPTLGPSV